MRLQCMSYEVEMHASVEMHWRVSGWQQNNCLRLYWEQCSSIMLKLLVRIQHRDCDDLLGSRHNAVT